MDPSNHLKSLLQTQLASDASAVRYLPYCLSTLNAECLKPSSQTTKWTNRIHSLLHSKDPGTRWAGLCLAYKTALLSQSLMIDAAQSWITVALPLLSRNEPLPISKAAVRLLRVIFSSATNVPEFQRQVSLPYIIKFTGALLPLADNHSDIELKLLCLETLTRLISIYPTNHRVSSSAIAVFTLRHLNGSPTGETNENILIAASQLYSVLPLTGGKVGAVNLWRKSLDETLAFGWEAFHCLRTTFPNEGQYLERPAPVDEPQITIPLNQDKLRCSVVIINDLLRSAVERPVQVPIGKLVKFISALLASSVDSEVSGFVDPIIRSMEVSAVPYIWKAGHDLLISVATRFPYRLDANAGRLLSVIAYHVEHTDISLSSVKAIEALIQNSYPLHSPILPNRLVKAILPSIAKILATARTSTEAQASTSKSKNAKKRARNYEGDEVFNVARQVVCGTTEEEQILLTSIDVIKYLFHNPELSQPLQSLIARIITSLLVTLPRTSPTSISHNPKFIHILHAKIQSFSLTIGTGTTSVLSKTLPFVIESALITEGSSFQRDIGLLLHPRVPPLVRSMPHLEALSLFKEEQSQEEVDALESLKPTIVQPVETENEDVVMNDILSTTAPPAITTTIASHSVPHPLQPFVNPVAASPGPQTQPVNTVKPVDAPKQNDDSTPIVPTPRIAVTSNIPSRSESIPRVTESRAVAIPVPQDEGNDDEEMPTINMESDSEDDDSQ